MPATVLLIDANAEDEQLFREELALICGQPLELQVVRTLTEALARLKPCHAAGPADVILLDLHLPDSLGLTTPRGCSPRPAEGNAGTSASGVWKSACL